MKVLISVVIGACVWIACAVAAAAAPDESSSDDAASSQRPPNVVLIISDDQHWGDYGFMGHRSIETPRLDRLAAESRVFRYGYVPTSLCCPSLASIITGLYPHQHQVVSNDPPPAPPAERARLRERLISKLDDVPTLPRLLASRGYQSLQTGKWWQGNFRRGGFTHGMTHGDAARRGRHGDEGLSIGREGIEPITEFLDANGDKPFLIWYAPFLPHAPHNPPERLLAKYRERTDSLHVARYWAMCEWFDETCGQLLDALSDRKLDENTMVVYVTDNGWIQDPQSNRFAPRSKLSPYDGGLRTPIMIRWPGKATPGVVDTPVSSIDLAPTILTAAGLKPTAAMPGVNLLDEEAVAERKAIFGEVFTHDAVDLNNPASGLRFRWCISVPWKLIVPNPAHEPDAKVELFDIVADPYEQHDLAKQRPEMVAALRARIDAWWPIDNAPKKPTIKPQK